MIRNILLASTNQSVMFAKIEPQPVITVMTTSAGEFLHALTLCRLLVESQPESLLPPDPNAAAKAKVFWVIPGEML